MGGCLAQSWLCCAGTVISGPHGSTTLGASGNATAATVPSKGSAEQPVAAASGGATAAAADTGAASTGGQRGGGDDMELDGPASAGAGPPQPQPGDVKKARLDLWQRWHASNDRSTLPKLPPQQTPPMAGEGAQEAAQKGEQPPRKRGRPSLSSRSTAASTKSKAATAASSASTSSSAADSLQKLVSGQPGAAAGGTSDMTLVTGLDSDDEERLEQVCEICHSDANPRAILVRAQTL
jgi:hypothetical protein